MVVHRNRSVRDLCKIIDGSSCAVYIFGSHISGKTNLLYQVRNLYRQDRSYIVLKTDLIGASGLIANFLACIRTFKDAFPRQFNFINLENLKSENDILDSLNRITIEIGTGLFGEKKFLWTIDEGHLLRKTEKLWKGFCNLVSAIVHNSIAGSNYTVLVTSVSPRVLRVGRTTDSPFNKVPFCDLYFTMDEIILYAIMKQ